MSLFGTPGRGDSVSSSSDGGGVISVTRSSSLGTAVTSQAFSKQITDKYRLGEELGRGAYGKVFKGLDTSTGEHVAIKQLSLDKLGSEQLTGISNEVDLLKALNHRNVVKYIGSFRSKHHLYIVMEYVENGALSNIIKQSNFGPFPESLVAVYVQQVLQGLLYLHEQGVVHRDIKGANILTNREGLVKLADFGVAAKLGEIDENASEATPAGTPYWMAPEVVELKTVTTASDIWSVGCLAVELLTGQPPYFELQPLSALYNIVQDPHPPLPLGASPAMQEFLLQCFNKDAASRPTARQLLQHPWITYNRKTLRNTWNKARGKKVAMAAGGDGSTVDGGGSSSVHTSVTSVIERILAAESDDGSVSTNESPKAAGNQIDSVGGPDSVPDSAADMVAREEHMRQEEFLERVAADPRGTHLLRALDELRLHQHYGSQQDLTVLSTLGPGASLTPPNTRSMQQHHAAPREEAELLRQVASLRMTTAPGERSLQQEAASAASARTLASYVRRDANLRSSFVAADGISGCRELLDSPSERVILPVLDLLCALVEPRDPTIIDCMCLLGVLPAALRFTGPTHPPELRLQAGRLAESLALASERGLHLLVACQGIPFLIGMIDDVPQSAAQLELVRIAVAGCWAILHHSQTPGWLIRTNQYMRLMAHHGLPGKLVRALPWVLKRSTEVINALRSSRQQQQQQHSRTSSGAETVYPYGSAGGSNGASPVSSLSGSLRGMRLGNRIAPEEAYQQQSGGGASSPFAGAASLAAGDGSGGMPMTKEVMDKLAALLEAMVNLFAVVSHGDSVVKTRMCQLETINNMFGLTTRMPPHLQLRTLQTVRRLAGDQSCLGLLEEANAIAYAIAQLARDDMPLLQAEALCTLHLLTQLNRGRQEKLAASGATNTLCKLVLQPPEGNTVNVNLAAAARGSTVAVLCSLAHGSVGTRQELWRSGALAIFLQLLKEDVYQASVLEAIATWLDAEPAQVEAALLEDTALSRLVFLLPESPTEDEQLQSVVSPLSRIVIKSSRVAVALADNGLAGRVVDLLKRPTPRTALALLELLRLLYENQTHPKEFIIKYRVQPTLAALARGGPEGDQVLVRKQAQNLLKAFQVNSVF